MTAVSPTPDRDYPQLLGERGLIEPAPRPVRLGDRVLPAVLHPDIRRVHGSLARRKPRPEAAIRFVAAVLADIGRTHLALCRPCLRFRSGRGQRAVRMGCT